MLLGVDVGGTFTDAVLFDGSALHTAKAPTTPGDQSRGVLAAVEAALARAGARADQIEVFAHGMTVGTNALLEQRGARTALVATDGFTDLLDIARQSRPELYRLCAPKPAPLVPDDLRVGARERIGPAGVVEDLAAPELDRIAALVRESGAESVAICLLFAYLDPSHEREIAERLRDELPDVHISASHEVLPQFREYERCSTTVIDAYLSPLLGRYLDRLSAAAGERGLAEPAVMKSSGGIALAGGVELDLEAARAALRRLGDEPGLDELETAEGIVRVANQEMARALRVVTVERGVDPRRFALMPFGGAGPMHAAALAEELGMERILCPRASGVLSALGLIASERRRDTARTVLLRGGELTAERIAAEVDRLRESIGAGLEDAAEEATYELRYRGQAFELGVPGPPRPDPADLVERFAAEHERRYGYRDPDAEVELVNVRLALVLPTPAPEPEASIAGRLERSAREARFGGEWIEAEVLRGEPEAGTKAEGPCVFELPEATLVLPPRWRAEVDSRGTNRAERSDR